MRKRQRLNGKLGRVVSGFISSVCRRLRVILGIAVFLESFPAVSESE